MTNWTRTAALHEGSLLDYINEISIAKAREVFGKPTADEAYIEEEMGYDGDDWTFTNGEGGYIHLYSRWGQLRVGGANPDLVDSFKAWLKTL